MATVLAFQMNFSYHCGPLPVGRLELVGSWDAQGRYDPRWSAPGELMVESTPGCYQASVELKSGQHDWRWGVRNDHQWAVFESTALSFDPATSEAGYIVCGLDWMGVTRQGSDLIVRLWAPHARAVTLWLGAARFELSQSSDYWTATVEEGWPRFQNAVYGFEVTTSEGEVVLRSDPYARHSQGPQRGVDDLYLNREARQGHRYLKDPQRLFWRFESDASRPVVLWFEDQGRRLNKKALRDRLGTAGRKLVTDFGAPFWSDQVGSDGRIALGGGPGAWSVVMNRPESLVGLRYFIEDEDGRAWHDPYDNLLEGLHQWPRLGVLRDRTFDWQHDAVPFKVEPDQMVIYQLHIGSVLGSHGNVKRSHLGDVTGVLDALVTLGVNAIEVLPTNSFEGLRDWGYMGTSSLSHSENYGFHEADRWVDGATAVKRFVDEAHRRGLRVITDVVYNHIGGAHSNLWEFDGRKNPWFEWSENPTASNDSAALPLRPSHTDDAKPRTLEDTVRHTPWGPIPAFNKPAVWRFFLDHTLSQFQEYHFDGIRFDFTNLIHSQAGGGQDGWSLLGRLHRTIRHFFPQVLTHAEEFPQHPVITTHPDQGGAGFDAMWNTEFQHRLVFSHHGAGLLDSAACDRPIDLDHFLDHLLEPEGFSDYGRSVTVISNHDEVGNACRIALVASGGGPDTAWSRQASRLVFGLGMLAPGIPLFFQGTEILARNHFSWGRPSTWDLGWESPQSFQREHLDFCRRVIALRTERSDFRATYQAERVHTDNHHRVLAFGRGSHLVIGNFGRRDLAEYTIRGGSWRLVLDSSGSNEVLDLSDGRFFLPAGGLLVYQRVDFQETE